VGHVAKGPLRESKLDIFQKPGRGGGKSLLPKEKGCKKNPHGYQVCRGGEEKTGEKSELGFGVYRTMNGSS